MEGGVTVLLRTQMQPIINWVRDRYGSDYIRLYEGNPYDVRKNKCKICGKPAKRIFCSRQCTGKAMAMK